MVASFCFLFCHLPRATRHSPKDFGLFHVPRIRSQRQQKEERAEDIFAFSYPSHRLHMSRMQRKQCRHHHAPPKRTRHPLQDAEQQQSIGHVENQIRKMMATRLETEDLTICYVGQPGQRVPVACVTDVESPAQGLEGQPRMHVRVPADVCKIIVINEVATENSPIHPQSSQQQRQAGPQDRAVLYSDSHERGFTFRRSAPT